MRIITNKVSRAQELDKVDREYHWYGVAVKETTEYSTVNTFEYEVTDLSNELQMLVDAINKKHKHYSMTKLDEDILKAKSNILKSEPFGMGDGYYNVETTHNSLKFIPTNFIEEIHANFGEYAILPYRYETRKVPLPKRDNVDFLQQRLIDLEDEIRYVAKLHNNDKTIEEK